MPLRNVVVTDRLATVQTAEARVPEASGLLSLQSASGGMTASRRADGIASRGKTRCKMY